MKWNRILILGSVLALGLTFSQNSSAQVVVVRPEAQVVIAPGPAPFAGAVWVGGEYRWDRVAGRYVIVEGRWIRPPRPGRLWVPGHWRPVRGGYIWIRGHWR